MPNPTETKHWNQFWKSPLRLWGPAPPPWCMVKCPLWSSPSSMVTPKYNNYGKAVICLNNVSFIFELMGLPFVEAVGQKPFNCNYTRAPPGSTPLTPVLGFWSPPCVSPLIHPSSSRPALCSPEFPPFISMLFLSQTLSLVFWGSLVLLANDKRPGWPRIACTGAFLSWAERGQLHPSLLSLYFPFPRAPSPSHSFF